MHVIHLINNILLKHFLVYVTKCAGKMKQILRTQKWYWSELAFKINKIIYFDFWC